MDITIRDPIYGFISLNELEKEIIDHPAFQRLRRINQLALSYMVYPGATHTRFEHSLGVMHLSSLMYDKLIQDTKYAEMLKEKGYNKEEIHRNRQLVRLASLLHDIGHTPFSHGPEELMTKDPRTKKPLKHENYSSFIIKKILKSLIEENDYNKKNLKIKAEEVASYIEFDPMFPVDYFLKELISSQLDADRGDYLLRDSYHAGVKYGVYDYLRLLDTFALGEDPETNNLVVGVTNAGINVAESLILARYQMFHQMYFHKTRRAFDYHLKNSLKHILPKGHFPDFKNINKFLEMDDYFIWQKIRKSNDKNSKAIINRTPIKSIYETNPAVDIKILIKVIEKLSSKGIWTHIDDTSKSWYSFDDTEIFVIDEEDGNAEPLSNKSFIIKSIKGKHTKYRVYVNPNDRLKAKDLISKIKR